MHPQLTYFRPPVTSTSTSTRRAFRPNNLPYKTNPKVAPTPTSAIGTPILQNKANRNPIVILQNKPTSRAGARGSQDCKSNPVPSTSRRRNTPASQDAFLQNKPKSGRRPRRPESQPAPNPYFAKQTQPQSNRHFSKQTHLPSWSSGLPGLQNEPTPHPVFLQPTAYSLFPPLDFRIWNPNPLYPDCTSI